MYQPALGFWRKSPSLEIFKTCLDAVLCNLFKVRTCFSSGVGLNDVQRSLLTPTCDSVKIPF